MTPEQFSQFLESNEKATDAAIGKYVNGKIDRLAQKLDNHISQHEIDTNKINERFDPESNHYILKDVLPIIEAFKGSKILGEFLKWASGVGVAYLIIKGFIK